MNWGQIKWIKPVLFMAALFICTSINAQDKIDLGIDAMRKKQFATAYNFFTAAATENTEDPVAVFFQGVSSNRLGRFQEAIGYIHFSRDLGGRHPEMAFEMGWASMRLGYYQDAIKYLNTYLEGNPKKAQAHEFLGRAYLGLGLFKEAENSLDEAEKLNPKLKPTVTVARALIKREKGKRDAAIAMMTNLETEAPDNPLSRKVAGKFKSKMDSSEFQQESMKRWRGQIELEFGYNDNVISVGDVPLPTDISGSGGFFGRITTQASFDVLKNERDLFQVGGMYSTDIYGAQFSASQFHSVYVYAEYLRQLTDRAKASFHVSNEYLNVGIGDFRDSLAFRPAYIYEINPNLEVEFSYTFTADEYFVAPTVFTDRDGHTHSFASNFSFNVPETELKGNANFFVSHTNADGTDFDYTSVGFQLGLSHPLPGNALIKTSYTRIFDHYKNPNFLTGFTFDREDGADLFSAELSKKLALEPFNGSETRVFLRYNFSHNNSNIPSYRYNQHVVTMGGSLSF